MDKKGEGVGNGCGIINLLIFIFSNSPAGEVEWWVGNPLTNSLGIRCWVTLVQKKIWVHSWEVGTQYVGKKSPNSKITLNCAEKKHVFVCRLCMLVAKYWVNPMSSTKPHHIKQAMPQRRLGNLLIPCLKYLGNRNFLTRDTNSNTARIPKCCRLVLFAQISRFCGESKIERIKNQKSPNLDVSESTHFFPKIKCLLHLRLTHTKCGKLWEGDAPIFFVGGHKNKTSGWQTKRLWSIFTRQCRTSRSQNALNQSKN